MIKTRIITDRREIEQIIPQCIELARKAGACLPFNYMHLPLLWWDHFNSCDGTIFVKKRGTNFLGAQSWLQRFYLLITEDDNEVVVGAVPLVSYSVKAPGQSSKLRILSFAGDYQLIPYQDFLVLPSMRTEVLSSIFTALTELLKDDHDLLFLEYIPDTSTSIPVIRKLASNLNQQGLCTLEKVSARRGGVWPWTIASLTSYCKKLHDKISGHKTSDSDLKHLIEELQNCTPMKLLFPATRNSLESQIRDVLECLNHDKPLKEEIKVITDLLSPAPIIYPFINLSSDRESYLVTLSKSTRRYFRRYNRRFKERGGFFEKIGADDITDREITDYLHLHSLRWGKESASLSSDSSINFHKDLCSTAAKEGYFTLFFACYQGKRIATHSCFDVLSRREGYITGRDPQYDELRASRLLYMETICDAIDKGFDIYDLGQGWFDYKMNFTKTYITTRNFFLSWNVEFPDLNKIFLGYEYIGN